MERNLRRIWRKLLWLAVPVMVLGIAYVYLLVMPIPDERRFGMGVAKRVAAYHESHFAEHGVYPGPVVFEFDPAYMGSVQHEKFRTDIYYMRKTAQFQVRLHSDGRVEPETWAIQRNDRERYPSLPLESLKPSIVITDFNRFIYQGFSSEP